MRLIDATEAATWARIHILDTTEKYAILDFLRECATIDAVPVVRCWECKYRADATEKGNYLCNRKMLGLVMPDDFCSFGERKDGEG